MIPLPAAEAFVAALVTRKAAYSLLAFAELLDRQGGAGADEVRSQHAALLVLSARLREVAELEAAA